MLRLLAAFVARFTHRHGPYLPVSVTVTDPSGRRLEHRYALRCRVCGRDLPPPGKS